MAFDDILDNNTNEEIKQNSLLAQAIKRREYNKQYQARLRQTSKMLTLEKKIDANLNHVIGYIKTRYPKEYAAWVKPVKAVVYSNSFFDNWLLLSAGEYKSIKDAFEVSGLAEHVTIKEFTKLFEQYYQETDSGSYTKD